MRYGDITVHTVHFDDLWQTGKIELEVPIDADEPFPQVLEVTPPPSNDSVLLVFRPRYIDRSEPSPAGWWDPVGSRLAETIMVRPGETAALAVDRDWLETRLQPGSAAPLPRQFICAANRSEDVVDVVFKPTARDFVPPSCTIRCPSSPLNIVERRDQVELARIELAFEWAATVFAGDVPGFLIHALTEVENQYLDLDLQLVEAPPDGESAAAGHIRGTYDADSACSVFATSLPVPAPEQAADPVVYRVVASPAKLLAAMIEHGRTAPSGAIEAKLSIKVWASLEKADADDGLEGLSKNADEIRLSFTPDESVTLELNGESVSLRPRDGAGPRAFRTVLHAHRSRTAGAPPAMQPSQQQLGLTLRYHGIHKDYRAAISAAMYAGESASPAHRTSIGDCKLVDRAARFTVPVYDMLKAALAAGGPDGVNRWACEIAVRLLSGDAGGPNELVLPPVEVRIEIEGEADWTLCVDLGTSAIAVWCGPPGRVGRSLHQLPLGAWLENIDHEHDESSQVAVDADDVPAGDRRRRNGAISALLPSNIGLASGFNLRDRFDVLSLGSLDNVGGTEEAVRRRLKALGRRYDVSAPFPAWHRMNEYFGQIVFEPKRKLITCRPPDVSIPVPGGVLCLDGDRIVRKDSVNLLHLLEDYFDEIATFLVPRVLDWAASSAAVADAATFGNALDRWMDGARQPRLIITHPAGMSHEKRRLYRGATQSFAASLSGRRPGTAAEAVLIPEALAAARFGISRYQDQNGGIGLSDGEQLFVALDIGAGTYDVTVLTAVIRNGEPETWTIRSHFGLPVGGIELDRALTARVAEIMRAAADDNDLQRTFEFCLPDPPSCVEDVSRGRDEALARRIGMRFLRAVKAAKIRLTDLLRRDCDVGQPYAWPDGDRAPAFSVKLSGLAPRGRNYDYPVQLRDTGAGPAAYRIAGEPGTQLRIDAASGGGPKTVWLDITRAALSSPASGRSELADYLKLLGDKLPRIARAAAKKARPGTPAHWIVTGRTALWPDLYSSIADVARGAGTGNRGDISPLPYPADDMKIAVIRGAQMLASEGHLDRGERVYNQLALVQTGLRGAGGRRITSIRYIPRSESSGAFSLGETDGPFQIARVVPCLDEREADGRTLLEHLEDIRNPPQLWWPVSHVRNPRQAYPGVGLQLRWETDGDGRTKITVENQNGELEVFGPYSEETVYGYD